MHQRPRKNDVKGIRRPKTPFPLQYLTPTVLTNLSHTTTRNLTCSPAQKFALPNQTFTHLVTRAPRGRNRLRHLLVASHQNPDSSLPFPRRAKSADEAVPSVPIRTSPDFSKHTWSLEIRAPSSAQTTLSPTTSGRVPSPSSYDLSRRLCNTTCRTPTSASARTTRASLNSLPRSRP